MLEPEMVRVRGKEEGGRCSPHRSLSSCCWPLFVGMSDEVSMEVFSLYVIVVEGPGKRKKEVEKAWLLVSIVIIIVMYVVQYRKKKF